MMLLRLLVLMPLLLVGCEYFEPATPVQCEALYDHLIALNYQSAPTSDSIANDLIKSLSSTIYIDGLENPTAIANDLIKSLSSTGINLILSATGEKEKTVRRCTTILTEKEALNCVEAKNREDWAKSCKFNLE